MPVTPNLKVRSTNLNLRSQPSSSGGNSTIVKVLHAGDVVSQTGYHKPDPSWATVKAVGGVDGYVKRSLLRQDAPGALANVSAPVLKAYNDAVWAAGIEFDDVTYKLGAKNPHDGEVDCSGWIAFINRLGFNAANAAAGATMFTTQDLALLNTHSDHQVSIPGYKIGQLYSLDDVASLSWRPGLLIGINFADYDWELNQGRVFEIDHIVQTVRSPDGVLFITQSSSGGGGVNRVRHTDWMQGRIDELRQSHRVHVIDIFGLADAMTAMSAPRGGPALVLPELDVSATPAG